MNDVFLFASCYCAARIAFYSRQYFAEREHLPTLVYHKEDKDSASHRAVVQCENILRSYHASWLLAVLDYYGELQTLYTLQIRKLFPVKVVYTRELFPLEDGGTVGIDWLEDDARKNDCNAPIVILQHGLCGHTYSHYMKGVPGVLQRAGFYVASFVARGCGGVPLTTPETFTASRTGDFRAIVSYMQNKYPGRQIFAIGYSLGAGLLLKYVGEEGEGCPLSGAVAISPAYDFHERTPKFAQYEAAGMVQGLRSLVLKHESFLKNNADSMLDWEGMINARTIRDFDQAAIVGSRCSVASKDGTTSSTTSATAQREGSNATSNMDTSFLHYASVDEYYTASSACRYSHLIHTPTLSISAVDDFLSAADSVPTSLDKIGSGLVVLKLPHGGHVSFSDSLFSGHGPHSCWTDRVCAEWLGALSKKP